MNATASARPARELVETSPGRDPHAALKIILGRAQNTVYVPVAAVRHLYSTQPRLILVSWVFRTSPAAAHHQPDDKRRGLRFAAVRMCMRRQKIATATVNNTPP